MDPSLLRERELFKKRALSTPAVEKRPAPSSDSSSSKKKKVKVEQSGSSSSKQNTDHSNGSFNLKALSGGSGYKFGVLAKIVNYMKTRHQRGDTHPLTLEEILDETQHLDIGLKQKQWLMSEALVNNPKIEVVDGKYAFKPKYNLKDKKALLRLLDKHDQRGLGGILLEDIEEGLPNAQKAIKGTRSSLLIALIRRRFFSTMTRAVSLLWMKFINHVPFIGERDEKPQVEQNEEANREEMRAKVLRRGSLQLGGECRCGVVLLPRAGVGLGFQFSA
ncbi:transcription initiation factor IIE subunit beta isoform 3-T3 [Pterocles gutturalis]